MTSWTISSGLEESLPVFPASTGMKANNKPTMQSCHSILFSVVKPIARKQRADQTKACM